MTEPLLDIHQLSVTFRARHRIVKALRNVSFRLEPGRTLALVGESGSGKSVTSLAIMGLLPPNGAIPEGRISYTMRDGSGIDLAALNAARQRAVRGAEISMIFQEPMSSLNPLFTIGDQIGEMLLLHTDLDGAGRRKRVLDMLNLVEIPAASDRLNAYPHELSGGMRQRVMIALALVCNPSLLIADEPTTALDVTIQAQILDLMRRLQSELGMSILFITHDMGVVAEMAEDVAVMYAGTIVEAAPVARIFSRPAHPYTRGLLQTIPRSGRAHVQRLVPIPGTVPSLAAMPTGCAFAPRCRHATDICQTPVPLRPLPGTHMSGTPRSGNHQVACHHAEEISALV